LTQINITSGVPYRQSTASGYALEASGRSGIHMRAGWWKRNLLRFFLAYVYTADDTCQPRPDFFYRGNRGLDAPKTSTTSAL